MDSEALTQVFQATKAQAFALFNASLRSNEEVIERNILLGEHVVNLEQHYSLLSGNLEKVSLHLEG